MGKEKTIIRKANDILNIIGEQGKKVGGYDNEGDPILVDCQKYLYNDLLIIDNISIYYNGVLVFDERNSTYVPGTWELLLDIIHDSIPTLAADNNAVEEKQKRGTSFYQNSFKRYEWGLHRSSGMYDEALTERGITVSTKQIPQDFGTGRRILYRWQVDLNGRTVFEASQQDYDKQVIITFINGAWVQDFDEIITICNQKAAEAERRREEFRRIKDRQDQNN